MTIRATGALALLVLLASCGKPPPEPRTVTVPRPDWPEFAACQWGEVKGAKLSIWSFACGPEQSNEHLEAADALPGFMLKGGSSAEGYQRLVVRLFAKSAAAPLDSVLPAVRAASGAPATCDFVRLEALKDIEAYELAPVGEAKAAWDALNAKDEIPEAPCGTMGVAPVGDRYFQVMPGHAGQVLYLDLGSEIQIFDPTTLRMAP